MNKTQKSKSKARGKSSHWSPWHYLIIVGTILILFVFLRGNYGFFRYLRLEKQKKELIREIELLSTQRDELETEIERLIHNYRYIEKIVREKYKMGKAGEKIYFVIPPPEEKDDDRE